MEEERKSVDPTGLLEENNDDGRELEFKSKVTSNRLYCQFFLFCASILLSTSSYSGLIDLQSSINISDALGNKSLMLMSIATVICCVFFTPIIIDAIGAKNTLLLSQICYVAYVACNFYPVPCILLPGGVFLGVAEGLIHTPALMYCTYFGRKLAAINSTDAKYQINRLVGYYWGIYQMNEIIGNSISTAILHLGKTVDKQSVGNITHTLAQSNRSTSILDANITVTPPGYLTYEDNSNFPNIFTHNLTLSAVPSSMSKIENSSESLPLEEQFSMCGANDCYDESKYESKETNYIPLSKSALYIMISVYMLLALTAIPIMLQTPSLPKKGNAGSSKCSSKEKTTKIRNYFELMSRQLKQTASQFTNSLQLLLTPLTLYHGLYVSFISSEVNRAFVSCTIGVESVGLGMLLGGLVNASVAFVYGFVSENKISRMFFLCAAIAIDILLYVFCLLWIPTEDTAFLAVAICIFFGFTDGVWSPFIDSKYAQYFPKNEETAYSVNNLWNCVGFTLTYSWTTQLCVRQKIYIQIASLSVGVLCMTGADFLYKRKKSMQSV